MKCPPSTNVVGVVRMVMLMAKKPVVREQSDGSDDHETTTVKCYQSFRRIVGKLAKIKGNNVQDELQLRYKDIEDEYLKELAREKLEIERSRRGSAQ